MVYAERAPWPELQHVVACLWTLEGDAAELGGASQPVLPDGRPELILHFGDAFERVEADGTAALQPRAIFAGQLLRQLTLRPTGRIGVLGIRLHPHGAAALLRVPQHELAGHTLGIDDLLPSCGRALARVRDSADSPAAAVAEVQRALLAAADTARLDPRVSWVVAAIERRQGLVSIDRLSSEAGLTRRHLERLFQDRVGLSPKRLARIARFQRALACLDATAGQGAAGVTTAAACGYADQAHFVRDFRDLAGCAPGQHLLTRGELTGFFARSSSRG